MTRPHYSDGDYWCPACGEPWDAYGVRMALKGEVSDMTKGEAEKFMQGNGCPCCPTRLRTEKYRGEPLSINKINSSAIILPAGVQGENNTEAFLKRELHATDEEIQRAKEKLQKLGLTW